MELGDPLDGVEERVIAVDGLRWKGAKAAVGPAVVAGEEPGEVMVSRFDERMDRALARMHEQHAVLGARKAQRAGCDAEAAHGDADDVEEGLAVLIIGAVARRSAKELGAGAVGLRQRLG